MYSWVSLCHYAVNLTGGQPWLCWCLCFTRMSKWYEIACFCYQTQGQHIPWIFNLIWPLLKFMRSGETQEFMYITAIVSSSFLISRRQNSLSEVLVTCDYVITFYICCMKLCMYTILHHWALYKHKQYTYGQKIWRFCEEQETTVKAFIRDEFKVNFLDWDKIFFDKLHSAIIICGGSRVLIGGEGCIFI